MSRKIYRLFLYPIFLLGPQMANANLEDEALRNPLLVGKTQELRALESEKATLQQKRDSLLSEQAAISHLLALHAQTNASLQQIMVRYPILVTNFEAARLRDNDHERALTAAIEEIVTRACGTDVDAIRKQIHETEKLRRESSVCHQREAATVMNDLRSLLKEAKNIERSFADPLQSVLTNVSSAEIKEKFQANLVEVHHVVDKLAEQIEQPRLVDQEPEVCGLFPTLITYIQLRLVQIDVQGTKAELVGIVNGIDAALANYEKETQAIALARDIKIRTGSAVGTLHRHISRNHGTEALSHAKAARIVLNALVTETENSTLLSASLKTERQNAIKKALADIEQTVSQEVEPFEKLQMMTFMRAQTVYTRLRKAIRLNSANATVAALAQRLRQDLGFPEKGTFMVTKDLKAAADMLIYDRMLATAEEELAPWIKE